MLYSEFIENTGCRDNEHNRQLYDNLNIMYMNSELPKSTIYEYGKKLMDNTPSQEVLELRAKLQREIAEYKDAIAYEKEQIARYEECDSDFFKSSIKSSKDMIKYYKTRIKEARWVLEIGG